MGKLSAYQGNCYLGFDIGRKATKAVLIAENGVLLYSFYRRNEVNPIKTAILALKEIYEAKPAGAVIARSCSTGNGELLIKTAFMLDYNEVETVAHYYAAAYFYPNVEYILDVGGLEMKFIKINNGSVCNVTVADISAGLNDTVIKNAFYKVIKVSENDDSEKNIVVQGGALTDLAIYKSFEKIAGINVIRPELAGIMGALGAALVAREQYAVTQQPTTTLPYDKLISLDYTTETAKCKGCSNNCQLSIAKFTGGRQYITGNQCERGLGFDKNKNDIPNLYDYKLKRLFDYIALDPLEITRGTVGIPRALNIYENYPFWFTFFTSLGYRVLLSPPSNQQIYELGLMSIPSDSACYPAKLVHGHVKWLVNQKVDFIFYPALFYERNEFPDADNHYNCPVVISYCENIKNNIDEILNGEIAFHNPFMSFKDINTVTKVLAKEFPDIPPREIIKATRLAWDEQNKTRKDIELKGDEVLAHLEATGQYGIVLAGQPYHLDPEINHGIPELITSYGLAVLSEDAVSHRIALKRPLLAHDQWMYHSRLFSAACYVKQRNDLDFVHLSSYGCGLDAVMSEQIADILTGSGKIFTCLKIDEAQSLNAVRMQIRSLLTNMKRREQNETIREIASEAASYPQFTLDMKKTHTILTPQLSPLHLSLIEPAINAYGYNLVVLPNDNQRATETGREFTGSDTCYPILHSIGQIMEALLSGAYDPERTAALLIQSGGGCRLTNNLGLLRRALGKAGMENVPVISFNITGLESSPGMKLNFRLLLRITYALVFGDVFMRCIYRMRPYEELTGSVNEVHNQWRKKCQTFLRKKHLGFFGFLKFRRLCRKIIKAFDKIKITDEVKPRVGIVGETTVKYSPVANNSLIDFLEAEGAEVQVPDLIDLILYSFYNQIYKVEQFYTDKKTAFHSRLVIRVVEFIRSAATKAFFNSTHFSPGIGIYRIADLAESVVSLGNQAGEGWFLTGEMLELIEDGVDNIICVQPVGCLPNHIVGKGVIRELNNRYPQTNIIAVDYDDGVGEADSINLIKSKLGGII